ncbi:MAG: alpha/beta hydrolase-fold protein [Chloroflexi bacterium]|nr:alpha/beta hydrolase-fold protein [Chloroflexota bacterium]
MNKIRKNILTILLALLSLPLIGFIVSALYLFFQLHRTNGEILSSGRKRTYLLYVPKSYRPDRPTPLVISIHGYAEWPAHQMEISRWNRLAEEKNFIVVYPSGTGFPLHWRASGQPGTSQDVQFISDLIDRLEKDYNIDQTRIFANGLSNGGGMSFALACALSERIAAIGSVSGAYLLPWEECNPERPVPAIIFHGTKDPVVPFGGGHSRALNYPFPDVPAWVEALAAHNGCAAEPVELPAQGEVHGKRYTSCDKNAEVIFYTIHNGGHSWPGGGYIPAAIVGHTTHDIDATRVMWAFFQQHPLKK